MKKCWAIFFLCLLQVVASAQQSVPSGAGKYHELLRKRPQAGTIFERFLDAWLAEGTRETLRTFLKAKAAAPEATAADHQLLALFFAHEGEDAAAVAELDAALKMDEANADAWLERARAKTRLLDFDQALTSLEAAAKNTKGETQRMEVARLQGRTLLRLGRQEDALKVWQALSAARPDDLDLAEEVIELMADEGLYVEAAEQSKTLVGKTKPGTELMTRRLRLGDLLLRSDKRDEAMTVFESVLEQSGQDSWVEADVLARLAQPFRREDDIEGLRKRLEALHTANPLRPALTMELAETQADLGEKETAVKLVTALLERTPGRRDLQERFVALLERMERFEEAAAQMKRLVEQHAQDKELLVRLATLQERMKDPKAAQTTLTTYLKMAAGTDAAAPEHDHLRVARLYESWELRAEAGAAYAAMVAAHPGSTSAKEALAHFHHRSEAHEQALSIWKELVKAGGLEDVLRTGQALQSHNQLQQGLDLLLTRKDEFAQQPRFLALLSQLAAALKDTTRAMEWARQRLKHVKDPAAVDEAVRMALVTIQAAEAGEKVIEELQKQTQTLSIPDRCLLAALLEAGGLAEEADKALQLPSGAPADQLMLGAQRARLFETRQEWSRAAGVIAELMKIPGGLTSEHTQRLVAMHRRALETDKALAVIPEWKKLSPGAVQPWLEESTLQLERGDESASLEVLRQAARKFAEDLRVLTALAEALARSGRTEEARRAYVSLYEQTEDLQTRLRLLAPLAEMSRAEGQLEALLEEFQSRQRQNRGSAAPWMALAEIHRAVNNDEERRRCLYEASRMRPKDLVLLTEIARCEEDSGLTKEALRTLQTAATLDQTSATKQEIARLMIESGDDEAGYRLLLELAGGAGADARAFEKMADTMCENGDWGRAVRFLEPLLPQFPGDYRLRYLHATALEQEGRDEEAAAAFVELLGFHAELPEVSAALTPPMQQGNALLLGRYDALGLQLPDGAAEWLAIPGVASLAYEHRTKQQGMMGGWGYGGFTRITGGPPALPKGHVTQPPSVTLLSAMALYHLIEIGQGMKGADKQTLAAKIASTGMRDAELLFDVPIYQGTLRIPVEFLDQHPDHAALHAVWLVSSSSGQVPEDDSLAVLRRCVALFKATHPALAWMAGARALLLDTPEGLETGKQAITLAEGIQVPDALALNALSFVLGAATHAEGMPIADITLPADVLDQLFALGGRWNEQGLRDGPLRQAFWTVIPFLNALASTGRWEQLAQEIERARVRAVEAEKTNGGASAQGFRTSMQGLYPQPLQPIWVGLDVPASISTAIVSLLRSNQPYGASNTSSDDPEGDKALRQGLQKTLAALKTPSLALLLNLRLGNDAEAEKALAGILGAKDLREDHWVFAAWVAQQSKNWPLVVERLQKAAAFGAGTDHDNAILFAAQQADAESRLKMRAALQAVFARLHKPNMSQNDAQQLQSLMMATGFENEAKELQARQQAKQARQPSPRAIAAVNPYSRNHMRSSSNQALSVQAEKLLSSGQSDAAYAEIHRSVRTQVRQWLDPQQWSNARYTLRNTVQALESKTAVAGFGKWLVAREPAGWREMTEDAVLLEQLGRKDEALARYEAAAKLHPQAWQARTRAAVLLADRDPAAAASRLEGIPASEMTHFVQRLGQEEGNSSSEIAFERRLASIRLMTAWLEAQPMEKRRMDPLLAQFLMNLPQSFQQQEYRDPIRFPQLWSMHEQQTKISEEGLRAQKQLREAHDAYCTAMLRLPMLSEGGFAPLAGLALRDKLPLDKLEQMARDVLSQKGWLLRSTAAMQFWSGYSHSRYATQDVISMPHPEDVLILAAAQRGEWDLIQSEIIPLIENAKGRAAARQSQAYAELFRASNDSFNAAAAAWLKSMAPRVDPGAGGEIVRVWSERKLSAPIHDFFIDRVKNSQRGYINTQEITTYIQTLENAGKINEATAFIRRLRDLWLGDTPAKRQEAIQAYLAERKAQRSNHGGYYMGSNSAAQRFGPYLQLHQTLTQSDHGCAAGIPVLIEDALLEESEFRQNIAYSLLSDNRIGGPLEKLLPVLDTLRLLGDAPTFRAWFTDRENTRTLMSRLRDELTNSSSKEARTRLTEALQARKPSTFGSALILASLETDSRKRTSSLISFISGHRDAFSRLSPQALEEVHALFRQNIDDYPSSLGEAEKQAVAPLLEAEAAAASKTGERILAAKLWEDTDLEEYNAYESIPRLLAITVRQDRAKAVQILEKAITLLKGTRNYAQNASRSDSTVTSLLGRMGTVPQLMNETRALAEREKVLPRWIQEYAYSISDSDHLRDSAHVLTLFTDTPFVAEAAQFGCLPLPTSDQCALNRITSNLRSSSNKAAHDALEKELKQRQPQTFGVRTALLLMSGSNFKGDDYLNENRADFALLRPEEADALLRTLEYRSSKYRTPAKLPAELQEALQPLLAAREKMQDATAERVLTAPTLQSAELSRDDAKKLAMTLQSVAIRNPELSVRFYEKVTLLFMGESRRQNGSSPENTAIAYWLQECAGIAPFFTRALKRAETEGILSSQNWMENTVDRITRDNQLHDPAFVTAMLRGSVLLGDEKLFNAFPVRDRSEGSLYGVVLSNVRGQKPVKEAVQAFLKAEKPAFGVQLMQALLEDDADEALRRFSSQNSAQIAAMDRARLSSLVTVLEKEFHPLSLKAKDVPALAQAVALGKKQALELAEALLAVRDHDGLYRLLNDNYHFPRVVGLITSYDRARGLEAFRHVLKLIDAYDARNKRDRLEYTGAARFLSQARFAPELWRHISEEAVKRKLHTNEQWRWDAQASFAFSGRSKDRPFIIHLFESSGLFDPAETYNPFPGLGGKEHASALELITRNLWQATYHADTREILATHIDAQKTRTFGMDLVRCLLERDGDEAVKQFVSTHADDLVKLPKEAVPLIAETLALRTNEHIEYPPALHDLIQQKIASYNEMVLAGKPFEDFKMDAKTFESEFRKSLSPFFRKADFAGSAVFFDKAMRIIEEQQQRHGWEGGSNGWTLRSEMLSKMLINAPVNVFCFGMQLFHEDESGLLSCNGWHHSYGWGQWMRSRWEFWGGRASATEGMNGLVTEITRYLKPQHATLLSLPFHNLFTRLSPGDVSLITLWAENEKAEGARAAILRVLAIAGRLFQTACAESRGRDGTCEIGRTPVIDLLMKHYRSALFNDQINPRVRVALAHHLCHVSPFALPDDLVKKAAQLAAHENNEQHSIHGFQLAHIVRRFVRLPVDDEWQRIAQDFWNGWARRQTFAKSPRDRGRYYGTLYDPTFAMVQIAARARNERWLTQLIEKDATYLKTMRTTVALIATSGWETRAAEFLAKEAANLHDWNSAFVKWEPGFEKHAAALAKACKDPGLALIGELIIAESQDFPMPFVRAFKEPSTFEDRITALAPRVLKTPFKDEKNRLFAATFVSNYAPRAAVQHLSPLLAEHAAAINLSDFAFMQDSGQRAEAAYALSIPIVKKALDGDAKAWNDAFDALASFTGDNLHLRDYARNALADALTDSISSHWQLGGKRDATFWKKLLMPIIDASENQRDDHTGHCVSLLIPLLAASGETALADWRQSLAQSQLSTLVEALNQKDDIWRNTGRLCGDESLKSRLPLAARLKITTQLLANDVVINRSPSTVFTKVLEEGVLSRREIAAAAPALFDALAKKQRYALTLAEIALDAGKADIAREVIESALKTTPADQTYDLLEMRLGIEVREKRPPAAQEALTKLEAHPNASSDRFTLPILKRLLAEMK